MVNPCVRVELRGRLYGQLMMNTYHYMIQRSGPFPSNKLDFLEIFLNGLFIRAKPWGTNVTFERLTCLSVPIRSPAYTREYAEIVNPNVGTLTTETAAAPHITVVIRKRTATRGRDQRGHTLVFGWPSVWIADGQVVAGPDVTNLRPYMEFLSAPIDVPTGAGARRDTYIPILFPSRTLTTDEFASFPEKRIVSTTFRKAVGAFRRRQVGVGA